MGFSPQLAAIRFGCGLSPDIAPPQTRAQMLAALTGPDAAAQAFPVPSFSHLAGLQVKYRKLRTTSQDMEAAGEGEGGLRSRYKALRQKTREDHTLWAAQQLLRWSRTQDGLRERLVRFWADHFTVRGKTGLMKYAATSYAESAIRPHVAGDFSAMLISAVLHPMMLRYLDQTRSVGEGSRTAMKSDGARGLNENLAREILELHTLGVGGPYSQTDVRQLAGLLAGLTLSKGSQLKFRKSHAQPGSETIAGKTYSGHGLDTIKAALADLAVHPATARHIAGKLAVHFVSDTPDPHLVRDLEEVFLHTGGDLLAVTDALLAHPSAWGAELTNIKPPFDYAASAGRALGLTEADIGRVGAKGIKRGLITPLARMGQHWEAPPGPDGWPEEDENWVTAHGLAARMGWAMSAPRRMRRDLPDPQVFARSALGDFADGRVLFAARSAETRPEAIGLVLSAPAFQRR